MADDTKVRRSTLTDDIDRLSLEQALRDFEVSNARVIDLTQRLIATTNELNAVRSELESLRIAHGALSAHVERVNASKAYRAARLLASARRAVGR